MSDGYIYHANPLLINSDTTARDTVVRPTAPRKTRAQSVAKPGLRVRRRIYYLRKQTEHVKHLPKHLQPRWRYLGVAVESWPDTTVKRDGFQRALWYSAQHLLGDPGSAALDLSVLRFQAGTGWARAVVRTRRGERDRARAVLACVDSIDGNPVGLRVQGVSGTIQACEESIWVTDEK